MPTPSKGPRLGGGPAHERLLLNNMAGQLFENRKITTTETKAKRLRPVAERMITFAKRGDLSSRRRVLRRISDPGIVHELFTEIAPAVADRDGGYTRITKIGPRKGDKASMAVIELVLDPVQKKATVTEAESATKRSAASAGETASTETVDSEAEEPVEETTAEPESAETHAPATADESTDPGESEESSEESSSEER